MILGLGSVGGVLGCAAETRYWVLSKVFDGVPAPGEEPPTRRARRRIPETPSGQELPAPVPTVVEEPEADPAPVYDTFADVEAAFPRDSMGNLDWVAAARAGLARPRPGIADDALDIPPMPLDVHLDPGIPTMEVVFPHEAHTFWLRCDNCHPAIFQMRAGADPITMASIFAGEYCGRCHGKVAFSPATGCPRCHVKLGRAGP